MLRPALHAIKKVLLAFAGALGGMVIGCILSLLIVHLRGRFAIDFLPLKFLIPSALFFSLMAGVFMPSYFMMFFLCLISWLLNSDDSGGGHPSGDSDSWPDFLFNVSYMLGLILFAAGVLFSSSWIAGLGLLGIIIFSVGVFRFERRTKGEQAVPPNA